MKTLSAVSLFMALALPPSMAAAGDRPQPLPDQEDVVAKSLQPCPGGLERFLPGDYYFCSAARNYWSGHPGLVRESLKDAARWASKPAQYALGVMYFNGDRAEKNRPLGLAWLAIAAERHDPAYEPTFVSAYRQVSPEELAQANVYWNELRQTYADKVAAPRAERRFNREYEQLAWAANFGGSVFVDGITMPPGYDDSDRLNPRQSGFSLARMLQTQKTIYFYGYNSHVYVGEAQLIPVDQLASRKNGDG